MSKKTKNITKNIKIISTITILIAFLIMVCIYIIMEFDKDENFVDNSIENQFKCNKYY